MKYQRMTYSPVSSGYAMDIMVIRPDEFYYLIIQNINTRYIYAFPIHSKSKEIIFPIIQEFHADIGMASILADGEKAWNNPEVKSWLDEQNIYHDFTRANYFHHIPILDSSIRTLRLGCDYDVDFMSDETKFHSLVYLFNNTINKNTKLTPTEMTIYPELEYSWIRHCERHNRAIEQQYDFHYEKGNILLVHFDESKTAKRFEKVGHRREFNTLCEFRGYSGQNLAVKRLDETTPEIDPHTRGPRPKQKIYIVPYYYAVWIARSIDVLPRAYAQFLPNEPPTT
jgi:hypothetical protein